MAKFALRNSDGFEIISERKGDAIRAVGPGGL